LDKVPEWLRPRYTSPNTYSQPHLTHPLSLAQSNTKHPIAVDFFAWPTLRDRLVQNHMSIFQSGDLSKYYSQYLRFDWPFAFEDAFFLDEETGAHCPSPLFERYHGDLKYWTMDPMFYTRFPEMRNDIEGDQRRFCEVEVS
jgi:hypothetical protein